jgi:hypothetical protein
MRAPWWRSRNEWGVTKMTNGDLHEPEQPATAADWAAFEFEPVPSEELNAEPTYADWMRMSRNHLVTLFFARKIIDATSEELKKLVSENNDESGLAELLQRLASTGNTFECFYGTARAARARLICAGSAAEVEAQRRPLMSMKAV